MSLSIQLQYYSVDLTTCLRGEKKKKEKQKHNNNKTPKPPKKPSTLKFIISKEVFNLSLDHQLRVAIFVK